MRKFLSRTVILILVIICSFVYWKYAFTYSEGYRAGLLQKFSSKGSLFKTYEGEMILSSVQSNTGTMLASEKFLFSVNDEQVARKIERMQGENVVVHYTQKNGTLPWRGETVYLVDSVAFARQFKEERP